MNNTPESRALSVPSGSASEVVAKLPDGFYFFKHPAHPEAWGIIERLGGNTWRIGEQSPIANCEWSDGVAFYPALPPNGSHEPCPTKTKE